MNINKRLSQIAEIEFSDIVEMAEESEDKLRIYLIDESYIDVWFSRKMEGRYAYHWERGHIDGKIYRHDNIPHKRWEYVKTFPAEAIKEVLEFVRKSINFQSSFSMGR
ncbi:MAG: DUF6516 family protein [Candidatus Methanoperedens sp.]|nr:DUF6516 family protein [Candidatus Methanoperedens sp.]